MSGDGASSGSGSGQTTGGQGRRELCTAERYFANAFNELVKHKGISTQTDLAQKLNKTSIHIGGVKLGKRSATFDLAERISQYFGYSLAEMLEIGQLIQEGKGFRPFLPRVRDTEPHSLKRARIIWQEATKLYGLEDIFKPTTDESVRDMAGVPEYVSGKTTDDELFKTASHTIKVLLNIGGKRGSKHGHRKNGIPK